MHVVRNCVIGLTVGVSAAVGFAAPGQAAIRYVGRTETVCVAATGALSTPTRGTCPSATVAVRVPHALAPQAHAGVGMGSTQVASTIDLRVVGRLIDHAVGQTIGTVSSVRKDGVTVRGTCLTAGPGRPTRAVLAIATPALGEAYAIVRPSMAGALEVDGQMQPAGWRLLHLRASAMPVTAALESGSAGAGFRHGEVNIAVPGVHGVLGIRARMNTNPAKGLCTMRAQVIPGL